MKKFITNSERAIDLEILKEISKSTNWDGDVFIHFIFKEKQSEEDIYMEVPKDTTIDQVLYALENYNGYNINEKVLNSLLKVFNESFSQEELEKIAEECKSEPGQGPINE